MDPRTRSGNGHAFPARAARAVERSSMTPHGPQVWAVEMIGRSALAAALFALVAGCSGTEQPDPAVSEAPSGRPTASSTPSPIVPSSPADPPPPTGFERREDLITGQVDTGAGSGPSGVAIGHGSVWVATHRSGELLRIDPRTRTIVARITIPGGADYLEPAPTIAPGAVVLCVFGEPERVVSVDPATDRLRTRRVPCQAYAHGALGTWLASGDRLTRIDPVSLEVLQVLRPDVPSTAFNADLVQAGGSLWVSHGGDAGDLYRVDPRSGEVLGQWSFGVGNFTLAQLGTRVYFTNPLLDQVSVVDAATNKVVLEQAVPGSDEGDPILSAGHGQLWASTLNGGLARLDPKTLEVIASGDLGNQDYVGEVAVDKGRIWHPTYGGDSVLEVRARF
jgi:DNA-binding beta-propeller fold protein YncE